MEDVEEDPISNSLQHRRIPHGRSRRNGHSSGKGRFHRGETRPFDPLRSLGMYEVKHGVLPQFSSNGTRSFQNESLSSAAAAAASYLIIHELTTQENGLVATFRIGGINGMGLLSGSRKDLQSIVDEYDQCKSESEGENEDEDKDEDQDQDEEGERENEAEVDLSANDVELEHDDPKHQQQPAQIKSTLEEEDDRINRRARAFEKNSFRNPKFWMRWKVHGDHHLLEQPIMPQNENENENGDGISKEEENKTAYLIFSGNDCTKFEGTITSRRLGWDNVKLRGHKIKSKVATCPLRWNECNS